MYVPPVPRLGFALPAVSRLICYFITTFPRLKIGRFVLELTQLEVFRVVDGALDSHRHLSHPHPWPQNGSLQASVTSVTGSDVIRFPEVLLLALPGKLFSNWDHTSGRTEEFGNLSTRFCV